MRLGGVVDAPWFHEINLTSNLGRKERIIKGLPGGFFHIQGQGDPQKDASVQHGTLWFIKLRDVLVKHVYNSVKLWLKQPS
jgi:hypothetical protein